MATTDNFSPALRTNLSDIATTQQAILDDYQGDVEYISAMFFAVDHDQAELVSVPLRDGVLQLDAWLLDPAFVNHLLNHPSTSHMSVQKHHIARVPAPPTDPRGIMRLPNAYTVFYFSQLPHLPPNVALHLFMPEVPDRLLLRGNVLVLKHPSGDARRYRDMDHSDVPLVTTLLRSTIELEMLDHVDEDEVLARFFQLENRMSL